MALPPDFICSFEHFLHMLYEICLKYMNIYECLRRPKDAIAALCLKFMWTDKCDFMASNIVFIGEMSKKCYKILISFYKKNQPKLTCLSFLVIFSSSEFTCYCTGGKVRGPQRLKAGRPVNQFLQLLFVSCCLQVYHQWINGCDLWSPGAW